MKNEKVVLFKTPIMKSLLSHFTPRNAPFLQRRRRFHIFLSQNGWGEEGFPFFRVLRGIDPVETGWGLQLRGLEHVATNHGVGGSNPSSPTTGQKGKDLSLWGQENHDRDSGPKAMELGCGYFVEMEWPYLTVFFLLKKAKKICGLGHNKYSMPLSAYLFLFYAS